MCESPLTPAQWRALQLIASGRSHKAAAATLGVTEAAVKSRIKCARRHLRARNTTHAVALAVARGLVLEAALR